MICNEIQYRNTKAHLDEFKAKLLMLENNPDLSDLEKELFSAGINSQIEEFIEDLEQFDRLKRGEINVLTCNLNNLPDILIQARIAKGWTQEQLAISLNVATQSVQRDESTRYSSASFEKILKTADVLGIFINDFKVRIGLPKKFDSLDMDKIEFGQNQLKTQKQLLG